MKLPKFTPPDFSIEKLAHAHDVVTAIVEKDGCAPKNYHATSMYPEYYKVNGEWKIIEELRMDCVPVIRDNGKIEAIEFRNLKKGDRVILGRDDTGPEGIYLYTGGFSVEVSDKSDSFSFRGSRSRETSFQRDYENLADVLKHDKENGHIVWVMGPAVIFSKENRDALQYIIENGYAHAIFGGNAVITHDLEGSLYNTALGIDINTGDAVHNGHYHHLDAINTINSAGSVESAIKDNNLTNGLTVACFKHNIPMILASSCRDDGPMCNVIDSMSKAQAAMREHTKKATTVICLASTLHMIATGNLTPSYVFRNGQIRPVFFYGVDVSEFPLNKLKDRGSLEVTTIVSNIQDFLYKLTKML